MRPGRVLLLLLGWTCTAHSYSNVALRGKATQSAQYDSALSHASNAIDGNRESDHNAGSCSHTTGQTNPWWRVDLLDTYVVTSIVVVNRGDCCPGRLDGAEIHVGDSLQQNGANNPGVAVISHIPAGQSQTFNFSDRSVQGRYVSVVLPGTGKYLTLCEVEVYGHQAPTANVALRGKATQSAQYDSPLAHASNAIDGNRESEYSAGSCAHTTGQTNPWWRVDLLDTYVVTSIVVVNRGDCCAERLDGAEIHVGNSLQQNGANNPGVAVISHIPARQSQTFNFDDRSVQGRYVFVVLPGTGKYLTLCEVEVYGYQAPTGAEGSIVSLESSPKATNVMT